MITIFVGIGLVIITLLIHHETLDLLSRGVIAFDGLSEVSPDIRSNGDALSACHRDNYVCRRYYLLMLAGKYGTPIGEDWEGFGDILYFSFVTYSSLGYGDIRPEG